MLTTDCSIPLGGWSDQSVYGEPAQQTGGSEPGDGVAVGGGPPPAPGRCSRTFGGSMNALIIAVVAGIVLLLASLFIDRVLIPFHARRSVEKILKSKAKHDPRALEDPKYGTVIGDADWLKIRSGKGDSSELRWSDVEEVHAYKRDLFTTDLICLAFKKSGREEYYEIHEEMAGYHDLLEALPSRLPEFAVEWFFTVAFPAFETNHQIIWKRSPNRTLQATTASPGT